MLHQYDVERIQQMREAIGDNSQILTEKIRWFKLQWCERSDSHPQRLIGEVITHKTPLNAAIILDNDVCFKTQCQNLHQDIKHAFRALYQSCLCGSEKIGEHILDELGLTYTSEDCISVLEYVCASPNHAWAIKIATEMASENRALPDGVFLLCHSETTLMRIKELFKSSKPLSGLKVE
jgi:hypothetical protein